MSGKERIHPKVAALLILLFMMGLMIAGCDRESDDIPTAPPVTVDVLVEEGWEYFNDANFADAAESFAEAANARADFLEAYLGLGFAFAQNPDNIESAKTNLSKVLTFAALLEDAGEIESSYADVLRAETYSGRAALYLTEGNYTEVIEAASMVEELQPDFEHRWVEGFDLARLRFLKAESYFGSSEYDLCLFVLNQIDPAFESGLVTDGVLLTSTESISVELPTNPQYSGLGMVTTAHVNLVYPLYVHDPNLTYQNGNPLAYEIYDYVVTGDVVYFIANPVPDLGDTVDISYRYASDFGEFMRRMREKLDTL